jgi:hypothetical protein
MFSLWLVSKRNERDEDNLQRNKEKETKTKMRERRQKKGDDGEIVRKEKN